MRARVHDALRLCHFGYGRRSVLTGAIRVSKRKEEAEVLTEREYNLWQECLEEHDKITEEIKRIQEEEESWILVEEPWTLVEKEEEDRK